MVTLTFLGTSDSKGVPRFFCNCEVCTEARLTGHNLRTRPSLLVQGEKTTLLDMSYDLRLQLNREGIQHLDQVCVTHAHNDHILGFGDVYDYIKLKGISLPIYAAPEVAAAALSRFPYIPQNTILPIHTAPTIEGYTLQAIKVPHGANGEAYAFKFTSRQFSWAYMPDSFALPEPLYAHFLNLDLLILGTAFWKEHFEYHTRSLYDVTEAIELPFVKQAKTVYLTHLGHDIHLLKHPELPPHIHLAYDGLKIQIL